MGQHNAFRRSGGSGCINNACQVRFFYLTIQVGNCLIKNDIIPIKNRGLGRKDMAQGERHTAHGFMLPGFISSKHYSILAFQHF
jgi:hypothetical protein